MSSALDYDEVLRTAQMLNESDRVRLVQELLHSLKLEEAPSLDEAWLIEIDQRSNDLDSGAVQSIPWAEVRRRAREQAGLNP